MNYFVLFTTLCMYFDIFLPTTLVIILSRYVLSARWYVLNMWYMNFDGYIFLRFVMIFFIIFLTFYVAFCAYRPSPIQVVETDPSRCRRSRRLRPRLWTMSLTPAICANSLSAVVTKAKCSITPRMERIFFFFPVINLIDSDMQFGSNKFS